MLCYSNNGFSFRAVDGDFAPQTGEVMFQDIPTADQLDVAFPGYKAATAKTESNAIVLAQIATLEASVTQRRIREAALTDAGKTWLADVDSQITTLRGAL